MNFRSIVFVALSACVMGSYAEPVNVQILSATVKDKTVPGAQVILQKDGQTSISVTTDQSGKAVLQSALGEDNNAITLIVKKEGFSPLVAKCPCNGMAYAISETMTQLDGLRVVLNWGEQPQDLDLHTVYQGNHIYFEHKEGTEADLDVDDTDGYGPETITIRKKLQGKKYVFAVYNYSADGSSGTSSLSSESEAKVFVYIGQSMIRSYYVPADKTGSLWVLFGIDENGAFHDINQITDIENSDKTGTFLGKIVDQSSFGPDVVASVETIDRAKKLNKKGEDAYHAGNIDESTDFYRQAIDLYPNYGQAYSNLGLSYMKLNRSAEAIWASRKAIELAEGSTAPTVRASSYYNIAKMYEAKSQWADAKQNYELALQNKTNDAYTKGIQRMTEKLNGAQ
jgi:hypothetical protein